MLVALRSAQAMMVTTKNMMLRFSLLFISLITVGTLALWSVSFRKTFGGSWDRGGKTWQYSISRGECVIGYACVDDGSEPLVDHDLNVFGFQYSQAIITADPDLHLDASLLGPGLSATPKIRHYFRFLSMPLWAVCVLFALWPTFAFVRRAWCFRHPQGKRTSNANCEECGYNLTANVSGICPECGNPTCDGGAESGTPISPRLLK
jgi:hypothetical protein